MSQVNIHEAKTHLSRLIERAASGEEIVIARSGKPVAKLVPFDRDRTPRQLGTTIGFDELPVHYGCRIVDRTRLGTHLMLLGIVEDLLVRPDVTPDTPLEWCPWAGRMAP